MKKPFILLLVIFHDIPLMVAFLPMLSWSNFDSPQKTNAAYGYFPFTAFKKKNHPSEVGTVILITSVCVYIYIYV